MESMEDFIIKVEEPLDFTPLQKDKYTQTTEINLYSLPNKYKGINKKKLKSLRIKDLDKPPRPTGSIKVVEEPATPKSASSVNMMAEKYKKMRTQNNKASKTSRMKKIREGVGSLEP